MSKVNPCDGTCNVYLSELAQLQRYTKKLEAALLKLEWSKGDTGPDPWGPLCPLCNGNVPYSGNEKLDGNPWGHKSDCLFQIIGRDK